MQLRSFEEFVKIYNVKPLNSPRRSCEILDCGSSKFYDLVKAGDLTTVKIGRSTKVPAEELYARYVAVLTAKARAA
jgi:excisionase family DNA binding protein